MFESGGSSGSALAAAQKVASPMKPSVVFVLSLFLLAVVRAQAQGTFVYDQESSSDEVSPFGSVPIQGFGSVGQSFTPSLTAVGFVRLRQFDINPGNSLGATLVVNLRANAINGPIIGTATPVALSDSFVGGVNFFFPSAVPVTSGSTYFLETLVQSGDTWGATVLGDTYPNGTIYGGQFPASGQDLWFREGIIVPEPSVLLLCFIGMAAIFLRRRVV